MTRPFTSIFWSVVLALLVLEGCATTPEQPPGQREAAWTVRLRQVSMREDWEFRGRAAVRHRDDGWQAGLNWLQHAGGYEIDIRDPLGRKVAVITGTPAGVRMVTSRGENTGAATAELLMHRLLGWSLPVSGMRYWVRAIPVPGIELESLKLDAEGRPTRLSQSGWAVAYEGYRPWEGVEMPRRITLRNGEVRIRLVVSDWKLGGV